jgi:hypothetical protein
MTSAIDERIAAGDYPRRYSPPPLNQELLLLLYYSRIGSNAPIGQKCAALMGKKTADFSTETLLLCRRILP